MPVSDYSTTAASNTAISGIDIAENCAPSGINNAIRQLMADVKSAVGSSGTVASATTTDIGAVLSSYIQVTGTTTITGLGTIAAGTTKTLEFAGALTLTHNGTSLILPNAANITTVTGDVAEFVSEGSGNWRCMSYTTGGVTHQFLNVTGFIVPVNGMYLSAVNTLGLATNSTLGLSLDASQRLFQGISTVLGANDTTVFAKNASGSSQLAIASATGAPNLNPTFPR